MIVLLAFLFLFFTGAFIVGLISPKIVIKGNAIKKTRKNVILIYGVLIIFDLILMGKTESPNTQSKNLPAAVSKQSKTLPVKNKPHLSLDDQKFLNKLLTVPWYVDLNNSDSLQNQSFRINSTISLANKCIKLNDYQNATRLLFSFNLNVDTLHNSPVFYRTYSKSYMDYVLNKYNISKDDIDSSNFSYKCPQEESNNISKAVFTYSKMAIPLIEENLKHLDAYIYNQCNKSIGVDSLHKTVNALDSNPLYSMSYRALVYLFYAKICLLKDNYDLAIQLMCQYPVRFDSTAAQLTSDIVLTTGHFFSEPICNYIKKLDTNSTSTICGTLSEGVKNDVILYLAKLPFSPDSTNSAQEINGIFQKAKEYLYTSRYQRALKESINAKSNGDWYSFGTGVRYTLHFNEFPKTHPYYNKAKLLYNKAISKENAYFDSIYQCAYQRSLKAVDDWDWDMVQRILDIEKTPKDLPVYQKELVLYEKASKKRKNIESTAFLKKPDWERDLTIISSNWTYEGVAEWKVKVKNTNPFISYKDLKFKCKYYGASGSLVAQTILSKQVFEVIKANGVHTFSFSELGHSQAKRAGVEIVKAYEY